MQRLFRYWSAECEGKMLVTSRVDPPELQTFCLVPSQGLGGRREGGQCAHTALDAQVVAILQGGGEGGQDAGHLHVGWTHRTRMAATSMDQGR